MIEYLLDYLAAALDKILPERFVVAAVGVIFWFGVMFISSVLVMIWIAMFYM